MRIPIHLGVNPGRKPSEFFHGQIKELRVSSVVRYESNFKPPTHFDADDETLVLLKFDEGKGIFANDDSGNEHHGSLVNGTWVRAE